MCYVFDPLDSTKSPSLSVQRVGWREASTFLGFCGAHDYDLFSGIENQPFLGSDRQILLIGYRALCHELYQKQAALEADPILRQTLDRGLSESDQRELQRLLAASAAGGRAGLNELWDLKAVYDQILRTEDYSLLHSLVLWFQGSPCVASTSIVHADFDLHGKRLQNLARDPAPIHGFTFAVIATAEGCAFVAAWLARFDKCDALIRSLLSYDSRELPSLLIEFFFAYVENTYFSEAWWSTLPEVNRSRLTHLAGIPVQYGNPFSYSGLRHVEWEHTQTNISLN
jgi:hypothetical protein